MLINYLNNLSGNFTLITANQRLAAYLINQYDQEKKASGLLAWPSLSCLPLLTWLQQNYLANHLLSEFQALHLWHRIIRNFIESASGSFSLLNSWGTAQNAYQAWQLIHYWQIPLALLANTDSEETDYFYQWCRTFQTHCQQQQTIESVQLISQFIAQLAEKKSLYHNTWSWQVLKKFPP